MNGDTYIMCDCCRWWWWCGDVLLVGWRRCSVEAGHDTPEWCGVRPAVAGGGLTRSRPRPVVRTQPAQLIHVSLVMLKAPPLSAYRELLISPLVDGFNVGCASDVAPPLWTDDVIGWGFRPHLILVVLFFSYLSCRSFRY